MKLRFVISVTAEINNGRPMKRLVARISNVEGTEIYENTAGLDETEIRVLMSELLTHLMKKLMPVMEKNTRTRITVQRY